MFNVKQYLKMNLYTLTTAVKHLPISSSITFYFSDCMESGVMMDV